MIKPVTFENKNDWAELVISLWPELTANKALQDLADGGHPHEYLYYVDGQPVAFMSLSLRHDYVEGTSSSPVGYLEGIYVNPGHRKRGIAGELVRFAKQWAIKQGCTELASDCELDNEASRLFHERIGFLEANRVICFTMDLA